MRADVPFQDALGPGASTCYLFIQNSSTPQDVKITLTAQAGTSTVSINQVANSSITPASCPSESLCVCAPAFVHGCVVAAGSGSGQFGAAPTQFGSVAVVPKSNCVASPCYYAVGVSSSYNSSSQYTLLGSHVGHAVFLVSKVVTVCRMWCFVIVVFAWLQQDGLPMFGNLSSSGRNNDTYRWILLPGFGTANINLQGITGAC